MRFIKPIDEEMIKNIAGSHSLLATVEDNVVMGCAESAVNEVLAKQQILIPTLNLGLPDHFQEHGSREQLLEETGLDAPSITSKINEIYPLRDCEQKSAHVVSS